MGLKYRLGVDGISILFVMLTTFMMPLVIAASWNVETRVKEYMIAFLLLETLMLGVFMALDLVLFYLFFEVDLGNFEKRLLDDLGGGLVLCHD